ncbi:hypothetical protein SAMN05444170_5940 [Bradyrhizobium erythrophlei]|uniref:Uncharacterized protein n=1 Tax=Bradyrhizobium erythrophlei TaxID=1437360 RepID=A0A1M7UNG7_9BRAD|nr:hypothetical protein SAMN05444170_5940 [Bradyrhizobium erythrophlei]
MSLSDTLDRMPRVVLADAPAPIQPLKRIEEAMGPASNGVELYVKRDDRRDRRCALGRHPAGSSVVLLMTGGAPALFVCLGAQGHLILTARLTPVVSAVRARSKSSFPRSSFTRRLQ